MNPLRRSIFITFFSTNASAALQFFVTLVLARLLTPSEVGIFSITVMFTNIASIFRDFGISAYLQREKDLTSEKIKSALGFMITTSWIMAFAIYFASDYIASYYNEPGIGRVMRVLSISFILVPFASFFYALLARNFEAGKQAIVNAVSTIVYGATCLGLAWQGMSYMALAWANVVNIAATIIVYLLLRPSHIPLFPSFKHWGDIAKFGTGAIFGGAIDRINAAIPEMVLGKINSTHDVGIYSRASGLIGIFYQIAGPTISYNSVPFLAKNHHSGQSLAPLLSKATSYITAIAWPVYICIFFFPKEIIYVLYGEKWIDAAPIAVVLACVAALRTGSTLCNAGLTAVGRPYLSAANAGSNALARILLIILIGSSDLLHFTLLIGAADVLTLAVSIWLMSAYMEFSFADVVNAHWQSIKACAPCVVVALLLSNLLPESMLPFWQLICLSFSIIVTWILSIILFRHPLCNELPSIFDRILPEKLASHIKKYVQQ